MLRLPRIEGEIVILGIGMALFAIGMSRFVLDTAVFDQSYPVQNLTQIPINPILKAGETLHYVARYDKREDCTVTRGGYSVVGRTDTGDVISIKDFSTTSYGTWPEGKDQTVQAGVGIPKTLPPGAYVLSWRYCWRCQRARGVLCYPPLDSGPTSMTFRVTP